MVAESRHHHGKGRGTGLQTATLVMHRRPRCHLVEPMTATMAVVMMVMMAVMMVVMMAVMMAVITEGVEGGGSCLGYFKGTA